MKSFSTPILLCALMILTVTACSKESIDVDGDGEVAAFLNKDLGETFEFQRDENGPSCPTANGRCTVVSMVTAGDDYGLSLVFDAIETGTPQDVITVFIEQNNSLTEVIDVSHIDAVIGGELTAEDAMDSEETHYLILSSATDIEVVYRFGYN